EATLPCRKTRPFVPSETVTLLNRASEADIDRNISAARPASRRRCCPDHARAKQTPATAKKHIQKTIRRDCGVEELITVARIRLTRGELSDRRRKRPDGCNNR